MFIGLLPLLVQKGVFEIERQGIVISNNDGRNIRKYDTSHSKTVRHFICYLYFIFGFSTDLVQFILAGLPLLPG